LQSESFFVRLAILLVAVVALAGCGSSGSASSPTPTPGSSTGNTKTFSHPPAMTINPRHSYTATVVTTDGTLTIKLLPQVAPSTVNNFVFLARHHYYDGNLIHRIMKGFMFQTGDPTGTGAGGPGYTIKDEKVTLPYMQGVVAMANTGQANSGGSQFFVVLAPKYTFAKPSYTIFGRVVSGFDVLAKIENAPVQVNPGTGEFSEPVNPVTMQKVTIHEGR
jgi:cyclophilin family peptidyl-prolyl cis-trans isomerase